MKLFDTHSHLTDERFDKDREALIMGLRRAGVELVLDVACNVLDFEAEAKLADKYKNVYSAYGVHPHSASDCNINECLDKIKAAMKHEKAVAVGEMGLDYHYGSAYKKNQKELFAAQLDLAQELKKPVVLHIREAFLDCMDILKSRKNGLSGVMHCFSGSVETARECLDMGLYIALGGAVTFENARKSQEVAAFVPLDRLLLETDCPYMTPVPNRGKRNDPTYVGIVAQKIASLRRITADETARATTENGKRLFGLM